MSLAEKVMDGDEIVLPAETGELPLSDREKDEFRQDCETIINELGAFVRVGRALRRIKTKKLYRAEYGTFEQCVKVLFDLADRRARQLMQTSNVMEMLDNEIKQNRKNFSGFEMILPKNEAQAAALLRAPEEKRADIWLAAIERAGGEKVTARHVSNVIREEGAAELTKKVEKSKRQARQCEVYQPFEKAYSAFMKQVTEAYLDDWKKVSQKDVLKRLQVVIDYINIH